MELRTATMFAASAVALLMAACQAPEPTPPDPLVSNAASGELVPSDFDDGFDPEACIELSQDAQSLIAAAMDCDDDMACSAMPARELITDACLPALACYVPVSDNVDLDPTLRALKELDAQFRQECGVCPLARCFGEDRILATCEEHSCSIDVASPPVDEIL